MHACAAKIKSNSTGQRKLKSNLTIQTFESRSLTSQVKQSLDSTYGYFETTTINTNIKWHDFRLFLLFEDKPYKTTGHGNKTFYEQNGSSFILKKNGRARFLKSLLKWKSKY